MAQVRVEPEQYRAPGEYRIVSVVIPTHNRPRLLEAALESVLAQDVPLEVIVVDDASMPPAAELPITDDPRVTVIRLDQSVGPTKARNRGIELATGDFIAFLDDDDVWLQGKLRRCLEVFDATTGVGVVAHRTVFDHRETGLAATTDIQIINDPLLRFGVAQTPHLDGLVVVAQLAKQIGFDETFDAAQDIDFVIELARASSFAMVDDALAVRGPETGSAVGMDRRIAARLRLREKHHDVLFRDPASRAFYYLRLGHLYRRAGHRGEALRCLGHALLDQPRNAQAWRAVAFTILPVRVTTFLSLERRAKARR